MKKKTNLGGLILPDFKADSKATITKMLCCWDKLGVQSHQTEHSPETDILIAGGLMKEKR